MANIRRYDLLFKVLTSSTYEVISHEVLSIVASNRSVRLKCEAQLEVARRWLLNEPKSAPAHHLRLFQRPVLCLNIRASNAWAIYSDLVNESATQVCFLQPQEIGPSAK